MTQQLLLKSQTAAWILQENTNQLLYSSVFDNPVWLASNATLTSGQTDPSAGTTAYRMTATTSDALLLQPIAFENGALNRTFSIYIKRITGTGDISMTLDNLTFTVKTITGAWVRYEITAPLNGAGNVGIKITTSGDAVDIAWAQVEDGDMTAYAANTENRYTVTQITDIDYPANTVRGCAFLDGRFFVMTPECDIQQSAFEDGFTWAALDFIKSQADPSRGVFLGKIGNYIVAFKEWSIEFFYDAANPTASILSPVQNATQQIGAATDGAVQEFAGSIIFMGQGKTGFGRSFYMMTGTTPQKISTGDVEKVINTSDLSTVYSWCATVGSHSLYGCTLVDIEKTLVYDFTTQKWSYFTYLSESNTWSVEAISAVGVVTSTGHGVVDGQVIKLTDCGEFNGWWVAMNITADTFTIAATGTAIPSASGTVYEYDEVYFPIVASVRADGRQYMQDATSGALYEFSQAVYADDVGAIAARITTPKLTGEQMGYQTMGQLELIGDKIDSTAYVKYSDDDYVTYSNTRPVNLGQTRSRIRRLGNYNRRAFDILHVGNALFRMEALEV